MVISLESNDQDTKDHDQVVDELELVLDKTKIRYRSTKFVVNEVLPRKDTWNNEVRKFNTLINFLATTRIDTTI